MLKHILSTRHKMTTVIIIFSLVVLVAVIAGVVVAIRQAVKRIQALKELKK